MKKQISHLLLLLTVFLVSAGSIFATTYYVDGTTGNDANDGLTPATAFATIQYAINTASNGDVIQVAAATYNEDLTVNKQLQIIGANKSTTIIDGANPTTIVVDITSSNVVIKNFTIQNIIRTTGGVNKNLIKIAPGLSYITIENNLIGPNSNSSFSIDYNISQADNIYIDASTAVSHITIKDNEIFSAYGNGSGIMIYAPYNSGVGGASHFTIDANLVYDNARNGVEIQGEFNSSCITENKIYGNAYIRSPYNITGTRYGNGLVMMQVNGHSGATNGFYDVCIDLNSFFYNYHSGFYIYGKMNNIDFVNNDSWGNTDGAVFNVDANQWVHPFRPLSSTTDDNLTDVVAKDNLFYANARFGMYNTSSYVINAERCYWEEPPHYILGGQNSNRAGHTYSWGPQVARGSFTDDGSPFDGTWLDGGRDYFLPNDATPNNFGADESDVDAYTSTIWGKIDFSPYVTDMNSASTWASLTLRNITVDNANVSMPNPPYSLGIHNEFDNIQNAIDAAQEGDIIEVVDNGTGFDYAENIVIDKGLTIKAKNGSPVLKPSSGVNITSTTASNSAVIGLKIVRNTSPTTNMFGVATNTGNVQTCGSTYWNGATQLFTYSSIDPFVEDGDNNAPVGNNNSTNDNNTLGIFIICTNPPQNNLVLWLDATQMGYSLSDGQQLALAPPASFAWEDQAGNNDRAMQGNNNMRPTYNTNIINSLPAVRFTKTSSPFTSKYLWIDYNSSSNRPNALTDKMLFVLFKTPSSITGTDPQMVFELGGVTSGMNAYILPGTPPKIGLGIWRTTTPIQRRYFEFNAATNTVYLARAYYDGTNFQAFLNGSSSSTISFAGLTADAFSSRTGVGAAVNGTRYSWGSFNMTQGHHFDGYLGEVLLYNDYDATDWSDAKNYLGAKWGLSGYFFFPRNDGWELISEDSDLSGDVQLIPAYPNPFSTSTSFDFAVAETQNVTVELYDALGQKVGTLFSGVVNKNEVNTINIDGTNLSSGLYVYRILGETFTESGKVILNK
ncbi:MAG: T9SS type A sorting domain-containing protein [Candidatus Kapabacteria bacterium]|nr:T9SS type A sorting domain-containing protein [Candidatus Kapabacteria bacterium]